MFLTRADRCSVAKPAATVLEKKHLNLAERSGRNQSDNPAIDARSSFHRPDHAFGVDPRRPEMYGLRQARYDAAAADISDRAASAAESGRELFVLDVGCGNGTLARHLEPRPHFDRIRLYGTDVRTHADSRTHHYRKIFMSDLMSGQPDVPAEAFDVVVCEQVLEHLERLDLAIGALERALKPNGRLIVGVPVFIGPLAYLRKQYVRLWQTFAPQRHWSHVQSFSLASFLVTMKNYSNLDFVGARGFRIVSEGLVAPLENYRWWWRFNRNVGAIVPWACTEIQAVFVKRGMR